MNSQFSPAEGGEHIKTRHRTEVVSLSLSAKEAILYGAEKYF